MDSSKICYCQRKYLNFTRFRKDLRNVFYCDFSYVSVFFCLCSQICLKRSAEGRQKHSYISDLT